MMENSGAHIGVACDTHALSSAQEERQPMLSIEEYSAQLEELLRAHPLQPARMALDECHGLVLAVDCHARLAVPPFTNSAMDGFAVHYDSVAEAVSAGETLRVVADIPAGSSPAPLPHGVAARIMTGSPIPEYADTVVKVEDTDHEPGVRQCPRQVRIAKLPQRGANVRYAGEDVAPGDLILRAGHELNAQSLAALAGIGYAHVAAWPSPRVGILTTGSELHAPSDTPSNGETTGVGVSASIPDSNSVLLAGLMREAGAEVGFHLRCADDPELLRSRLAACPEIDLLVSAGGISAGAYEVIRQAFPQGHFVHLAQQPGGPQGWATVEHHGRQVPLLCLPGNPVSVLVSFAMYVSGAIAMLAHRADTVAPQRFAGHAGAAWVGKPNKTQLMPVEYKDGGWVPTHRLGSGSHLLASVAHAQAIAVVPAGAEVTVGSAVELVALNGLHAAGIIQ